MHVVNNSKDPKPYQNTILPESRSTSILLPTHATLVGRTCAPYIHALTNWLLRPLVTSFRSDLVFGKEHAHACQRVAQLLVLRAVVSDTTEQQLPVLLLRRGCSRALQRSTSGACAETLCSAAQGALDAAITLGHLLCTLYQPTDVWVHSLLASSTPLLAVLTGLQ